MLGLPGGSTTQQEVPVLLMHHGIGLGLVLARLFEEHFVDIAGTQVIVRELLSSPPKVSEDELVNQ